MILIEMSPPFVWKPRIERAGDYRGILFAWWRIGHVPHDFNEYIEGIAKAGVSLHIEQKVDSAWDRALH